jgi:hypothetical protein
MLMLREKYARLGFRVEVEELVGEGTAEGHGRLIAREGGVMR